MKELKSSIKEVNEDKSHNEKKWLFYVFSSVAIVFVSLLSFTWPEQIELNFLDYYILISPLRLLVILSFVFALSYLLVYTLSLLARVNMLCKNIALLLGAFVGIYFGLYLVHIWVSYISLSSFVEVYPPWGITLFGLSITSLFLFRTWDIFKNI